MVQAHLPKSYAFRIHKLLCSTGRVLYCPSNIKCAQGYREESLEYHERARLHFKRTVGNSHHRTDNSCFKVAENYSHSGRLLEAIWVSVLMRSFGGWWEHSGLLEQADILFDCHSCYNSEKGRITLLKSIILRQQGRVERSNASLLTAHALYRTFSKIPTCKAGLFVEDFDQYVHVSGRWQ